MSSRAMRVATTLVVLRCLGTPPTVVAQAPAYASNEVESAQSLATRSIECMRRGEDGVATSTRLAAYREGLALAQRALALDDNNADAHFALFANSGRIMLLEGATVNPFNVLEAHRELDRALELDPNQSDALAAKGGIYRQLPRILGGNLQKAEECLTRSIEINPRAVGARIELAATYRDMGEPARALPLLDKAIAVAQEDGKLRQLAEARALRNEIAP